MKTTLISLVALSLAAAACAANSDDAASGSADISGNTPHDVFECSLSSGDLTDGDNFEITLGKDGITVDLEKYGTVTGKLDPNRAGVPSSSDRYLLSGIPSGQVVGLVVPKKLSVDSRAMVHIDRITDKPANAGTNDFLCHPKADPPPAGGASGVKGTLSATCKLDTNQNDDDTYGDTLDITLQGDNLTLKSDVLESTTGPFDTTYKPRTNTSYVRYSVDDLFEEYATDVLVEKPVLTGGSGKIKIEAKGETFMSWQYDCQPK
jgi:hypothetical protein